MHGRWRGVAPALAWTRAEGRRLGARVSAAVGRVVAGGQARVGAGAARRGSWHGVGRGARARAQCGAGQARRGLAALTEATRQQGALLQRMCETFTPPPSVAPRAPEQSAPPPTIPVATPATVVPPPVTVPSAPVAFSGEALQMSEAEQERMTESLLIIVGLIRRALTAAVRSSGL
uniref:Uncharacterized protein n=1 Tax=Ananas comosus var. bracteatus TaxID=296719 RepID=A0A6V7QHN1_ANACO|nr:unnamed protein product [Ananas comosus var. bracteatus]